MTKRKVTIGVEYDSDTENPLDWGGWKIHSFNSRHKNFLHPEKLSVTGLDQYGEPKFTDIGLRSKLRHGYAFWLAYFEHGECCWMLRGGPYHAGVEFRWDGRRFAGLLIHDGKPSDIGCKTYDERRKVAESLVENYTEWANGHCYWYSIDDAETEETLDSCGGFIGMEHIEDELRSICDQNEYDVVEVTGDAEFIVKDFVGEDFTKKEVVNAS